jgi:hypothetical protein
MSDISTNLSMHGIKLFSKAELEMCGPFNVKLIGLFVIMMILLLCFSSSINSLFMKYPQYPQNDTNYNTMEQFSDDKIYSYKDAYHENYANYQSTPLTSLDESLLFGQANRYIGVLNQWPKNNSNVFILDIHCNLYLLNGNPFGQDATIQTATNQKYLAYLVKDSERKLIGQLTANSDQVYKLKFVTDKIKDYVKYNQVDIVYSNDNKETVIMTGKLTLR